MFHRLFNTFYFGRRAYRHWSGISWHVISNTSAFLKNKIKDPFCLTTKPQGITNEHQMKRNPGQRNPKMTQNKFQLYIKHAPMNYPWTILHWEHENWNRSMVRQWLRIIWLSYVRFSDILSEFYDCSGRISVYYIGNYIVFGSKLNLRIVKWCNGYILVLRLTFSELGAIL